MQLRLGALAAAMAGALAAVSDGAEAPVATPLLVQAARHGWLSFRVVSGRLRADGTWFNTTRTSSATGANRSEKLNIRREQGQPVMSYEATDPNGRFSIEIKRGGRTQLGYLGKQDSACQPVEFTQPQDEYCSLAVGAADERRVFRAASLWHLLIAEPDVCRQHLLPVLAALRPDWKLDQTAAEIEQGLLEAAGGDDLPDRRRWARLVEQLADDQFARREDADRQLRGAGKAVLAFLHQLDFSALGAEQQYRVRRIIRSMTEQAREDATEQVVSWLAGDPTVWLALLSRPQAPTRRLAARHLARLLDEPIPFDPDADPEARSEQIARLRTRLGDRGR